MPRILRHSIDCPHCEQKLRVRSSRLVVPTLKDVSFQCVNLDCSATFGGRIELTHGIAPSLNPNPDVTLRMAPPRRAADNDNLGPQVISAPEVAPIAANDVDELSEAIAVER